MDHYDADDLLDVQDAAAELGKGISTVWLLARQYNLPRYRIPSRSKRTFFRWGDLRAALDTPQRIDRQKKEQR